MALHPSPQRPGPDPSGTRAAKFCGPTHEHLLVVDDEEGIRTTLAGILEDEGYRTTAVASAADARAALRRESFDLLILDIWLPDIDGIEFLEELVRGGFDRRVVMISGHANVDLAVKAIRLGAYDFLEQPLSLSRVLLTVEHALERERMERRLQNLSAQLGHDELLLGDSPAMRRLKEQLKVAAESESRILITGDNGTGKELVARQIHQLSRRAKKPFVDVNCAAIPEELIESELFGHLKGAFTGATGNRTGRFAQANGGTLFLDEIADMSLKTQAKVLRVLQEQRFEPVGGSDSIHVDVRVLAATNKGLEQEIRDGRFRDDLYFRLAVIPLHVPALRERGEDIPLLLDYFLRHFAREQGRPPKTLSEPALAVLCDYGWPGNVRELRNLAERLMIMAPGEVIVPADLPATLHTDRGGPERPVFEHDLGPLREAREYFERRYIEHKLQQCEGNVSRTAQLLGLERSHLYRKLRAYGIEVERA